MATVRPAPAVAAATPSAASVFDYSPLCSASSFSAMCSTKIAWLTNSDILLQKFQMIFLPKAPPIVPLVSRDGVHSRDAALRASRAARRALPWAWR